MSMIITIYNNVMIYTVKGNFMIYCDIL